MRKIHKNVPAAMQRKFHIIFSSVVLCCMNSVMAGDARQLFELRCASCHSHGADSFHLPESRLQEALMPGAIREHRFSLTEQEIADLLELMKSK